MFEKVGCVFPGQGSQYVGMGKALSQQQKIVDETFNEANDYLGFDLKKIIFEGSDEELKLTSNQQPALLTTSIAVFRLLRKEIPLTPIVVAGHSLGEYSCLVAAQALTFEEGVKLSHLRGKAMQAAVPLGRGSMAAILGLEVDFLVDICTEASSDSQIVVPANINSTMQVVISGDSNALLRAIDLAKKKGAKRAIQLNVSAPFHSPLMKPAADVMRAKLDETTFHPLQFPYVSNVDASIHLDSSGIKERLIAQITAPVLWYSSMKTILSQNVTRVLEIGPGNVLTSLFRRLEGAPDVHSIETLDSINNLLTARG